MAKIHDNIDNIKSILERYESANAFLDRISGYNSDTVYGSIHSIKDYYLYKYRIEDEELNTIIRPYMINICRNIIDRLECTYKKLSIDKNIIEMSPISLYVCSITDKILNDKKDKVEEVLTIFKSIYLDLPNPELAKILSNNIKYLSNILTYEYDTIINDDRMKSEIKDFVNCIREYVNTMEL